MIPKKQIEEIRKYLEKSENPLFLFDDDVDGLSSYLLLMKKYDKGHGIPVKTGPVLNTSFLRKIEEYCPDLVVVLDKADIEQEFIENIHVPLLWIDHHPIKKRKGVHYYNTKKYKDEPECTTEICYEITKEDLWIATAGAISDWSIPKYITKARKLYPKLIPEAKKPEDLLFNSDLGQLIRKMSLMLKGTTTQVRKQIYSFMRLDSPQELLENTTSRAKFLNRNIEGMEKEYKLLLKDARSNASRSKLLVYIYPSRKNSHTAELSNELTYLYPKKIIIVGREKDDLVKMSIRSIKHKIPKKLEKALEGLNGYGGGHPHACGGAVPKENFHIFLERMKS